MGTSKNHLPSEASGQIPKNLYKGMLAGIQAVALSYLTVLIPGLIAYILNASSPLLGDTNWGGAFRIISAVWLVALGGSVPTGDTVLGFPILGLLLLLLWFSKVFASVGILRTWSGVLALVATETSMTALLWKILVPGADALFAILSVTLVALLGAVMAAKKAKLGMEPLEMPHLEKWGLDLVPGAIYRIIPALIVICTILVITAVALGMPQIIKISEYYSSSFSARAFIFVTQLFLVPTLIVWALAWLSAPGFVVGAGTIFTSTKVITAPLPAIPLFGALPQETMSIFTWIVLVVVVLGYWAGSYIASRAESWKDAILAVIITSLMVGLISGFLALFSSGSLGPGRIQTVGVNPYMPLVLALEILIGSLIALVLKFSRVKQAISGRLLNYENDKSFTGNGEGSLKNVKPLSDTDDAVSDTHERRKESKDIKLEEQKTETIVISDIAFEKDQERRLAPMPQVPEFVQSNKGDADKEDSPNQTSVTPGIPAIEPDTTAAEETNAKLSSYTIAGRIALRLREIKLQDDDEEQRK